MTVREVPAETDPAIPGPPRARITIDVIGLKKALRRAVKGEVRFDPGTLAMYANDASNFRQVPIGVVVPRTLDDVVAAHRVCRRLGAPVLNRGGGTSLSGETVNYAVVIDHSKYLTGVGATDAKRRLVTCEPGVINEELNRHTGEDGLVFGPDPSSHSRCVIGGNIGNDSCGIHSVQAQLYGPGPRTSDNVHALEVVSYDGARFWVGNGEEDRLDKIIAKGGRKGEIYAALRTLRDRYADQIRARYPSVAEVPRRVSGYNLDELLPEKGFNVARALEGSALLWGHCHHRATGGTAPEQRLLEETGLSVTKLKGGCCGLAGSWGFEKGKNKISMDCGEQALLPAVRDAPDDTLVAADGFSCKTQIADARTGRRALPAGLVAVAAAARKASRTAAHW